MKNERINIIKQGVEVVSKEKYNQLKEKVENIFIEEYMIFEDRLYINIAFLASKDTYNFKLIINKEASPLEAFILHDAIENEGFSTVKTISFDLLPIIKKGQPFKLNGCPVPLVFKNNWD